MRLWLGALLIIILAAIGGVTILLSGVSSSTGDRDEELGLPSDNVREPHIIPDVPRDAIPPLFAPEYVRADDAPWLAPSHLILGYENNRDSRAYPLLILNWHEIVNDKIGGRDVVITYCPLCRSGIVFDSTVDGRVLSFGNTGSLYESAMVMYDKQTESYWWQVGGIAIQGPLEGTELTTLPSVISTWREWRETHPDTLVLSRNTGFVRNYDVDSFAGYDRKDTPPGWPVSRLDERLAPKEFVVGVSINGVAKAYPISILGESAFMDEVGGEHLLVITKASEKLGAVFHARIDGAPLTFFMEDGEIKDEETGSFWNSAGIAVGGPLEGRRLTQVPNSTEFWFAWALAHPDTEIGSRNNG
ncbi:MAG: DUF3179 domain-containing protein [Nitrososphaerales archaeon]